MDVLASLSALRGDPPDLVVAAEQFQKGKARATIQAGQRINAVLLSARSVGGP